MYLSNPKFQYVWMVDICPDLCVMYDSEILAYSTFLATSREETNKVRAESRQRDMRDPYFRERVANV
jgi:hypothetical protein